MKENGMEMDDLGAEENGSWANREWEQAEEWAKGSGNGQQNVGYLWAMLARKSQILGEHMGTAKRDRKRRWRNGEKGERRGQTVGDIGLAFECIGCVRIEASRSTSQRCQADACVVLDRALADSLSCPGGHLDFRTALRASRDARYCGRR